MNTFTFFAKSIPTSLNALKARKISFPVFILSICFMAMMPAKVTAQASGDYRSVASTAWNLSSTWETFNGSAWVAAAAAPSSSDGVITIRTGNVVTINTTEVADQLVIETGSTLTLNTVGRLQVNDGTGDDVSVSGTFALSGLLVGAGVIQVNSGGILQKITSTTVTIPNTIVLNSQGLLHVSGGVLVLNDATLSSTVGSEAWNSRDLKSRPH